MGHFGLIESPREIWPEDLGDGLVVENQDTGALATLATVSFASPCVEFSRFCVRRQHEAISARHLGEILGFLGKGRRGFLLLLDGGLDTVTVRPGDRVFLRGEGQ